MRFSASDFLSLKILTVELGTPPNRIGQFYRME